MEYKYVKFDENGQAYIEYYGKRCKVYNPEYLEGYLQRQAEKNLQEASNQGYLGGNTILRTKEE